MKTSSDEKGFTLIETLIAIAIMGIGLLALAALQTSSISGTTKAKKHSMAILLAENKIETCKNALYDAILPAGETEHGSTLPSDPWGIFTRTTTVLDDTPFLGAKTVTVSVSWPDKVARSVVLQTIITQSEN
jgi:prepilin-type N-terminal cleavage/methylation domain-containing protein